MKDKWDAKIRRTDPPRSIFWDIKAWEKKKGFQVSITLADIRRLVANPCSYCGSTTIKMTLDRIDNSIGHTLENVVPACIRCNLLRRDCPYEAWLELVPGLRSAQQKGLFGSWLGCLKTPVQHRIVGGLA